MKYSVALLPFIEFYFSKNKKENVVEKFEAFIQLVKELGYNAIELPALNSDIIPRIDLGIIKDKLREYNLELSAFDFNPDLSTPDDKLRELWIEKGRECVIHAYELGKPVIVLTPAYKKRHPIDGFENEWRRAVSAVREIGEYALKKGIRIALEPVQRYSSYMLNTVEQALIFAEDTGLENIGVMLDTFHGNIEEVDMVDAIKRAKNKLFHVHVADSHRGTLGTGHIDFKSIIRSLKETAYNGYISLEAWPRIKKMGVKFTSYNMTSEITLEDIKSMLRNSLEYLKTLERIIEEELETMP